MLGCMRTAVRIDDQLRLQAKQFAAKRGWTLTGVIEDALRETLARSNTTATQERIRVPPFAGKGLRPGVDLDNSAALLGMMEETR
jgi:hypothetical protein